MEIIGRQSSDTSECEHDRRVSDVDCEECAIRHRMLFADVDVEAASVLLRPMKHVWYDPGEVIYRQGEPARAIYSIRRGVIKLSLTSPGGDLRIVRIVGPGAAIGLEALVDDRLQHEAETLTEVDLCHLPLNTVQKLAKEQPLLCKRLMRQWHQQIAQADEHLLQLSTGSIKKRVRAFLEELDQLCIKGDIDFQLPSNPDIAALVGARVESVSRIMAEFKREGTLVKLRDARWVPSFKDQPA